MKQKVFLLILCLAFVAQIYASRTWSTTPAEDAEYMLKTFKILGPLIVMVGAPLILTIIIVSAIQILKHGGTLVADIFKRE